MTTFAEVAEPVRAIIAEFAQAQDDARGDDVADLFCADGVLEVPGVGVYEGQDAIRAIWRTWSEAMPAGPLGRHIVANTVFVEWDEQEARTRSDVIRVRQGEAGWAVDVVARYHDTFRSTPEGWRLRSRRDEFFGWTPPPGRG